MSKWTKIRDVFETGASLAGNYLLPGSSLVTDRLVSKGAQKNLNSTLGQIAQAGTGAFGSGFGSSLTGIPSASDIGAGWTNAGNAVGGAFGSPTFGTDISNGITSGINSVTGGLSDALSSAGKSTGISDLLGNGNSNEATGLSGGGSISAGAGSSSYGASGSGWNIPGGSSQLDLAAADPSLNRLQNAPEFGQGANNTLATNTLNGGVKSGMNTGMLGSLLGGATSLYENNNAQNALLAANKQAQAQIAPFVASGRAANSRLSDLLGTSGNTGAAGYGTLGATFNPQDLSNTPGYQFQLQQGNQQLDRMNAARGGYFSGGAIREGQQFAQGLADSTYNQQMQNYLAQQNQQYGELAGQSGQGFGAANASGNLYGSSGTAQAASDIATGNTINSTLASLLTGSGRMPRLVNGQIVY